MRNNQRNRSQTVGRRQQPSYIQSIPLQSREQEYLICIIYLFKERLPFQTWFNLCVRMLHSNLFQRAALPREMWEKSILFFIFMKDQLEQNNNIFVLSLVASEFIKGKIQLICCIATCEYSLLDLGFGPRVVTRVTS